MKLRSLLTFFVVTLFFGSSLAWAQFPNNPTWTTYLRTGQVIDSATVGSMEGLTGDNNGNFYVADRTTDICNVWKINPSNNTVVKVGQIGRVGCRPSGLTFDRNGNLYITNNDEIDTLTPDEAHPPSIAAQFATGVPYANGVAFDAQGNLLATDGTTNQGRVWKIGAAGHAVCESATKTEPPYQNCEEFFRIPPRRNGTDFGGLVTAFSLQGVGSERYAVPEVNLQDIVANGVALSADGQYVFVADTARGAIWRAKLRSNGNLKSATGCDPTLTEDTLCMDSLYVIHPLLEGIDGFILLTDGTILADANERNAIVAVAPDKTVTDAFQNPIDSTTYLRNEDETADPPRPLEIPTSPFASGTKFCTTNANYARRDGYPGGSGPKINCLDQNLSTAGLPLPVQGQNQQGQNQQ
jgi:sugar lactone lactonase YvrE